MVCRPLSALPTTSVDDVQGVPLSRPHSRGAEQGAQSAHIAALPPDDLAHVRFRDFQFDHVIIEMIDVNLIWCIDDPLGNFLEEGPNISVGFSHGRG